MQSIRFRFKYGSPPEEKMELSSEDVFSNTIEAAENIDSYSARVKMSQKMNAAGGEMKWNMDSILRVINNSLSLYQDISLDEQGETLNAELYYTPDHV